jgi:hypothetical protein
MKKYVERPSTVEAIQWDGTEEMAIKIAGQENFEGFIDIRDKKFNGFYIHVGPREIRVQPGDYVIQDWYGEYSIMSGKIFEKIYKELAE